MQETERPSEPGEMPDPNEVPEIPPDDRQREGLPDDDDVSPGALQGPPEGAGE